MDNSVPHAAARSNASGLTRPRWLWRRFRIKKTSMSSKISACADLGFFKLAFGYVSFSGNSATVLSQQFSRRLMLGNIFFGPTESHPVITSVLTALI